MAETLALKIESTVDTSEMTAKGAERNNKTFDEGTALVKLEIAQQILANPGLYATFVALVQSEEQLKESGPSHIASLKQEVAAANGAKDTVVGQLKAAQETQKEKEAIVTTLQQELGSVQGQLKSLQGQLTSANEGKEAFQQQLTEAQSKVDATEVKLQDAITKLASSNEQVETLGKKTDSLASQLEQANKDLAAAEKAKTSGEATVKSLERRLAAATSLPDVQQIKNLKKAQKASDAQKFYFQLACGVLAAYVVLNTALIYVGRIPRPRIALHTS